MKKLILILLLLPFFSIGQTKYNLGFNDGYKSGYCYNKIGCVSPPPPVTPVLLLGESLDNYQQGYNRGLLKGKNDSDNSYNNEGLGSKTTPIIKPAVLEVPDPTPIIINNNTLKLLGENKRVRKEQEAEWKRVGFATLTSADEYFQNKEYRKALKLLNPYEALNLDDVWFCSLIGKCYYYTEMYSTASFYLEKSYHLNKNDKVLFQIGMAKEKAGKLKEAKIFYKKGARSGQVDCIERLNQLD